MSSQYLELTKKEYRLFLVCIAFFISFLLVTFFRASFHSIDIAVNLWIPSIQSDVLTFFANGIAFIFDSTSLVIISLAISGILFYRNYKSEGLLLLGAMGGDALIVSVMKTLEHVARPTNAIVHDAGFSYPSGHSAGCVVFAGVLVYFAWRYWQDKCSRALIGVGAGVVMAVVGFDRVYLNVHWVSDVFGGWLFGAFWVLFVILMFHHFKIASKFESERFGLVIKLLYSVAVIVGVLVVLYGLFGTMGF